MFVDEAPDLALEPIPGPAGYHADFYMPFGKADSASRWVVIVLTGAGSVHVGPFDELYEARSFAIRSLRAESWSIHELFTPESWPGSELREPEEPEDEPAPLLDLIDGRTLPTSGKVPEPPVP